MFLEIIYENIQEINEGLDEGSLTEMLNEADLKQNGMVEIDEFLEVFDLLIFFINLVKILQMSLL